LLEVGTPDEHAARPAPIAIAPYAIDRAIRFINRHLLRIA
jgi:hypothetical protein